MVLQLFVSSNFLELGHVKYESAVKMVAPKTLDVQAKESCIHVQFMSPTSAW